VIPGVSQTKMKVFLQQLQGKGVTVKSAYQAYLDTERNNIGANELKIYGNTGAIIDIKNNPDATTSSTTGH